MKYWYYKNTNVIVYFGIKWSRNVAYTATINIWKWFCYKLLFFIERRKEEKLWCNFRHSALSKYFLILVATLKALPRVLKMKLSLFVVVTL